MELGSYSHALSSIVYVIVTTETLIFGFGIFIILNISEGFHEQNRNRMLLISLNLLVFWSNFLQIV